MPWPRIDEVLGLRDRYGWGARKILALLRREDPQAAWPAISTLERILAVHGRIIARRRRHRVPPQTRPLSHATDCNTVWSVDFKGQFRTGDGVWCYPLTMSDAYSRYLLRCQGLRRTGYESVRPVFEWAFREYGLPRAIRSDNGSPFASRAVGGLSRLSVWWIKLGILPDRISPGCPQQNGRHERMHLTLKQETATPPAGTWRKQQERFDAFRATYNSVRPHEALAMSTPEAHYVSSPRAYPSREPEMTYEATWIVRKIDGNGYFHWKHQPVFLSEALVGARVGLERVDDRFLRVHFGPVWLGAFDGYERRMLTGSQVGRRPELKPPLPADRPSATLQDAPPEP